MPGCWCFFCWAHKDQVDRVLGREMGRSHRWELQMLQILLKELLWMDRQDASTTAVCASLSTEQSCCPSVSIHCHSVARRVELQPGHLVCVCEMVGPENWGGCRRHRRRDSCLLEFSI